MKPLLEYSPHIGKGLNPNIVLTSSNKKSGGKRFAVFLKRVKRECGEKFEKALGDGEPVAGFLSSCFDLSNYLNDLSLQFPALIEQCWVQGFGTVLDELFEVEKALSNVIVDEVSLMTRLRLFKRKAALLIGLADLGGWWSAAQVGDALSRVADIAVQSTLSHLLLKLHETGHLQLSKPSTPEVGSGLSVLAMGKHGARELNYSSDIDLIVFYDPSCEAVIDSYDIEKHIIRLTKSLIRILQERTGDGYVFRTDLRLRPDPGSMPLAVPVQTALHYYESRGQNWERAAMIKARAVAGDAELGEEILTALKPFIWRRYLDYAAIADIHSIKRQIQSHRGYSQMNPYGHNVKLGRGGIREIEFFVQTQQLIAGGRAPELRGVKTLEMLDALQQANWIEETVAAELKESYLFLRDVEHRLQVVDDAQTHVLPEIKKEMQRIAVLCGMSSEVKFCKLLVGHLETVEGHYAALFEYGDDLSSDSGNLVFTGDEHDPQTLVALEQMGFKMPATVMTTVKGWHYGRYKALQSAQAREHLTELTPDLLRKLAATGSPDSALTRFDRFLDNLPTGFQLFSLLQANRKLLDLLLLIIDTAPRLADVITRRPHVFDAILEPEFFNEMPNVEVLSELLQQSLDHAIDYEDGLNRARQFAAEHRFLIGVRVLSGALPLKKVGEIYTRLAETLIDGVFEWVSKAFQEQHGIVPQSSSCIVALGNFGTRELTASSDLDILFLYEYEAASDMSDGAKPLQASDYFGRLTKRLISAFSAPTNEGIIYELDLRLRPHGAAGPIATSLLAFEKYHSESSWTWELMTLTRARTVQGDQEFQSKVMSRIRSLIEQRSCDTDFRSDILEMRELMDKERAAKSVWDIKLAKGGLIDLEFLAQWAVLGAYSTIGRSTLESLSDLQSSVKLGGDFNAVQSYQEFTTLLQLIRLCITDTPNRDEFPKGLKLLIASNTGLPDLESIEAHLSGIQKEVRSAFLAAMDVKSAKLV